MAQLLIERVFITHEAVGSILINAQTICTGTCLESWCLEGGHKRIRLALASAQLEASLGSMRLSQNNKKRCNYTNAIMKAVASYMNLKRVIKSKDRYRKDEEHTSHRSSLTGDFSLSPLDPSDNNP